MRGTCDVPGIAAVVLSAAAVLVAAGPLVALVSDPARAEETPGGKHVVRHYTDEVSLYDERGGFLQRVAKDEVPVGTPIVDMRRTYYMIEWRGQRVWIPSTAVGISEPEAIECHLASPAKRSDQRDTVHSGIAGKCRKGEGDGDGR